MSIATCYELREVWGFGCPNDKCKKHAKPAEPEPCSHHVSNAIFVMDKPFPKDDDPILSPIGHEAEVKKRRKDG